MSSFSPLIHHGNGFIQDDLRRLRKYVSLLQDLNDVFTIVNNAWVREGALIDKPRLIYQEGEIICLKRRGRVSCFDLTPSEGIRVIYAVIEKKTFVPLLVFSAKEEPKYPLQVCKRVIKERIKNL